MKSPTVGKYLLKTSVGIYFVTIEKTKGGRVGSFKILVNSDASFYEGRNIGLLSQVKTSDGHKLIVSVNDVTP